jgi:hypothetical protein
VYQERCRISCPHRHAVHYRRAGYVETEIHEYAAY